MAVAPGDSAVSENMESWHTCIMDPRKQNCSRASHSICSSEPWQSGASGALGGPWPSPGCGACVFSSQAIGTYAQRLWRRRGRVDQLSAMISKNLLLQLQKKMTRAAWGGSACQHHRVTPVECEPSLCPSPSAWTTNKASASTSSSIVYPESWLDTAELTASLCPSLST